MSDQDGILRFLTCGSVDDGKSTLIGHLLALTGSLYDDQLAMLATESARIGTAGGCLDYSLLLDGLLAEREQGITIDVAYRYFATERRKFIVADTPGHEQYTRNMATGASQCSAAIILVDALQGVLPQTRRHALICALLGIRHLLFAVNKMDLVAWEEERFRVVEAECAHLVRDLEQFGLPVREATCVPVCALHGDNLASSSANLPWYRGVTVLDWLQTVQPAAGETDSPLRLPVQYVIKVLRSSDSWQHGAQQDDLGGSGTFRAYAGTLASGRIACGDQLLALPSGLQTTVQGILAGDRPVNEATAGMSVALQLAGEQDIRRGDLLVHPAARPELSNLFKVHLVWMDEQPLYAGRHYLLRSVAGTTTAEVTRVRNRIDLGSYQRLATNHFALNDIGEAEVALSTPLPFAPYQEDRETGGFVLVDRLSNATVACGMVLHSLRRAENVHWHREEVSRQDRYRLKGQKPCVVWLTGLSASGKSTIANCLERRLHDLGRHTMLLDGDNIRHGLNKDLGFTEADRIENIRRIGEVARLLTDAGLIVITAFISPFRADREMVRKLLPEGEFIETFVNTPLADCERRDPKGLYKKARLGLIPNFTGINSPYEEPGGAELVLDTTSASAEECTEQIVAYLQQQNLV